MYTGDTDYANTYWPNLVKVLDSYYPQYVDETGMLTKPDSIGYGDYAFLPRSGPITYYNALYVHALQYAAQLADAMGKSNGAKWRSSAASVSTAVRAHNFDKSVGAFYDGGPCTGQTVCNTHAQDGNALAVVAGIANDTAKSVLDYWASTALPYGNPFYDNDALTAGFKDRVYAFISYFELEARFVSNQATSAFEEIRRLYGWMAAHDPKITMWEGIGPSGSPYEGAFTSMAHGWSTGIVPLLSNHVLGVKPTAPGFSHFTICPVAGDLSWASGEVPTPKGGISVSWTKKRGAMSLRVTAPKGTSGKVCGKFAVEGGHTAEFSVPA